MPKTICTNPDVEHSVLRPVCFDIARQVMEWTRSTTSIPILFPGETETVAQPNSTLDNDNPVKLPSDTKLFIEAELEYREDSQYNMAVHQDEHMPYFLDPQLGVSLRPVYSPSTIKLTFKLRESDRNAARRWRDDMRARIARYRGERVHTVGYYYMIPIIYVSLLRDIHELREKNAGYGDSVAKYLRDHFIREMTTMTTVAGTQPRLCIREKQGRVLGNFDFSLPDREQKDNESSAHAISFSYTVNIDIPIATAADFPWLVHQQFLPSKYRPVPEDLRPERVGTRASKSMAAFRHFESDVRNRSERETAIRIPEFNEYRPESPPPAMMLTMAVLTTAEYDDNKQLLPLMNLGNFDENFRYHKEWLSFIAAERKHITQYGMSPIYLGVTVGDNFLHPELYELTDDLDVVLKGEPNLRAQYHVAIYLAYDPTMCDSAVYERLRFETEGIGLYVAAVCPRLILNNGIPLPNNGQYSAREVKEIFERIRICNRTYSQATHTQDAIIETKMINILGITVERKE